MVACFFPRKKKIKNKKIWQQKWCMEVQSLYIAPLIHEKVFCSKSKLWQNLASGRKICSRCVKLVMINSLNFSNHFPVHWLLSQYLIYILSCFTFFLILRSLKGTFFGKRFTYLLIGWALVAWFLVGKPFANKAS